MKTRNGLTKVATTLLIWGTMFTLVAASASLSPFQASDGVISIQAEAGILAGPMHTVIDSDASAFSCVESLTQGEGTATFTFSVPSDGAYRIWCRVRARDTDHDSFLVSVDGGSPDIYDAADGNGSDGWRWTQVNGRGASGTPLEIDPRIFSLASGMHTILFRGGDPGVQLDRISITSNPDFIPLQKKIEDAVPGAVVHLPRARFYDAVTLDKDLTLEGEGAGATIIDGTGLGVVVQIRTNCTVFLKGLTVQGYDRMPFLTEYGDPAGAIYSEGPLSLVDCSVVGAGITMLGAGVTSKGSLRMERCMVTRNGAGLYPGAGVSCASLWMSECSISNNFILGNSSGGSGIYCNGPAVILNSRIVGNTNGSSDWGTLLLNRPGSRCVIESCEISRNFSWGETPPGLVNRADLLMSRSVVADNFSDTEPGFVNYGKASVENSTFSGNRTRELHLPTGAGIRNEGELNLLHVTIASNTIWAPAPYRKPIAAGIGNVAGAIVRIRNSIVAGNLVTYEPDYYGIVIPGQDLYGAFISEGHNLIADTSQATLTGLTNTDLYGVSARLGPLAMNGGPTSTHALLPGSLAIDAGEGSSLLMDQRGLPRDQPDIGAYEVLNRPTPILLPLPFPGKGTFEALLVGVPANRYTIQIREALDSTGWQDAPDSILTDAGGFATISLPVRPGVGSTLIRAMRQ